MKVYPIGYSSPGARSSIESILQNDERAILVDIRYSVLSKRKPDWSGKALQEKHCSRYLWVKELGNVNYYNGGPIEIFHPVAGIHRLVCGLEKGYNLILLCTCSVHETCHRKVVVDLLQQALPDIEVVQPGTGIEPESIMCLSIRQPYATWLSNPSLFVDAGIKPKTIENRDWNTRYRGPLLIHASATFEEDALDYWYGEVGSVLETAVPMDEKKYARKSIVGRCDLVDVVTQSTDPWFVGTYGFVLANARPLEPIPYRGQLKLFQVPRSIVEE